MATDPAPPPTSRPWPDGTFPTAEQLADWLTACTDAERVGFCQQALNDAQSAARCFQMNHDGLQAELTWLRASAPEAYRRGWKAAAAAAEMVI